MDNFYQFPHTGGEGGSILKVKGCLGKSESSILPYSHNTQLYGGSEEGDLSQFVLENSSSYKKVFVVIWWQHFPTPSPFPSRRPSFFDLRVGLDFFNTILIDLSALIRLREEIFAMSKYPDFAASSELNLSYSD